jgi:hypothetical protein
VSNASRRPRSVLDGVGQHVPVGLVRCSTLAPILRANVNRETPAAIENAASVCLIAYGVRCWRPAALTAGFQSVRRQLCRFV